VGGEELCHEHRSAARLCAEARFGPVRDIVASIATGSACLGFLPPVLEGLPVLQGAVIMRCSLARRVPADLQLLSMAAYNLIADVLLGFASRWRTLTRAWASVRRQVLTLACFPCRGLHKVCSSRILGLFLQNPLKTDIRINE